MYSWIILNFQQFLIKKWFVGKVLMMMNIQDVNAWKKNYLKTIQDHQLTK